MMNISFCVQRPPIVSRVYPPRRRTMRDMTQDPAMLYVADTNLSSDTS